MNITALTSTGKQTRTIERPHPLTRVMAWELRRFCASRLFWLQALSFFCFLSLVTWAQRTTSQFGVMIGQVQVSGFIAGTSAWGLVRGLASASLVLLILLLPFIAADGVTRDLHRRTHELLMTTTLPTRAYVWGRYLVVLGLGLGLALLLLAAVLGMGLLLHLTVPLYPFPQTAALLLLWGGMVLPATVLVSSLSFALGTLLPRLTHVIKIVIILGWIMGAVILPIGLRDSTTLPAWYVNWEPTSAVTSLGILKQYSLDDPAMKLSSASQFPQILLTVENKMPDIAGWFVPHLLLAGFSLVLVLVAALVFKRSREVLN